MQQRLAIARAILHNPPILLLDEPDTGLDQSAATMLGDLLAAVGTSERTVLMTTHNLQRGLDLGSRILMLSKGKIAINAPKDDVTIEQLSAYYEN
jgi:heme exporter protein A